MTAGLRHLVVGPAGHGVVRYAELLLRGADVPGTHVLRVPRRVGIGEVDELLHGLARSDGRSAGSRVHLHVTDHLLGRSPEEAADVVDRLASQVRLSLTLHDLPQASDGGPALRRRAAYARMARAVEGVVVSSDHEADLLRVALAAETPSGRADRIEADMAARCRVVPLAVPELTLPVAPTSSAAPTGGVLREVAVLGWVYPGKGHAEVLAALTGLPDDVGFRVLGGASPGHDDLLGTLDRHARAAGRRMRVDGWVDDADLPALLRDVAVPVFAPRHVSASASLTAWASADRRPVATRSRYTEEVDARAPGALLLVDDTPDALADGVRAVLEDPTLSWRADGPAPGPTPTDAAHQTFAPWPPSSPAVIMHGSSAPQQAPPPGPSTPRVAVVVAHYDAPEQLRLVLAGLAAQTLPTDRFEVVVADDGSPEPPALPETPYRLRLVRQEDDGFRLAAARNLGVTATTGEVLCFMDGDTVPEPGYLAAVLAACDEATARDPDGTGEVLVVGRRRHAELTGLTPERLRAWFAGEDPGPVELPEPGWLRDGYGWTDDLRRADDESYRYVIGAVMSMHRSLFDRVGGFEESFRSYGGEDWEMANRCWLAGAQLRHARAAVAWHDGVDFAGRDVDRRAVQNQQALTLATLLPSRATRPPGPVWEHPLVVVEVDDRGSTPEQSLLAVASLLEAGDVGVWLTDGSIAGPGAPLAHDPRVRIGPVPAAALRRCRARVRLGRRVELLQPLDELVARAPLDAPGLQVRHARDVARRGWRTDDVTVDGRATRPIEPDLSLAGVLRARAERAQQGRAAAG